MREKDGSTKLVEQSDACYSGLYEASHRIQNPRDPPLLGERWQWNIQRFYERFRYAALARAARHSNDALPSNVAASHKMQRVARVQALWIRPHDVKLRRARAKCGPDRCEADLPILEARSDLRHEDVVSVKMGL